MKPPPFGYSRPQTLDEALSSLAALGPGAKVLAGGQSLIPLLSMRLAAPEHLVDINRLDAELGYLRTDDDAVHIGALTRHSRLLADPAAATGQPLLAQATARIAHATIRNRGTSLGSIVHADPSAELPAVLALLGGQVRLASASGRRDVAAADFFLGPLESAVQAGELALEASVPTLAAHAGTAFAEIARRAGDYAVCGVAALVQLDPGGALRSARAAYLSVAATPLVLDLTDAAGSECDVAAAAEAACAQVEPDGDIHASADYRRHLVGVLTSRVLGQARDAALGRGRADSAGERG